MHENTGEKCTTISDQGMNSSQVQVLKYVGDRKILATTGQEMWCIGRNNLPPLNVIYKPYIGEEIADVNLQPLVTRGSIFNPINLIGITTTWVSNRLNGFRFTRTYDPTTPSVIFHAPIIPNVSIGQITDIESHKKKYQCWKASNDRTDGLILYGVSRGTAATFCAFAKEKYPEVKLVILEGAIDSVENVLSKRASDKIKSEYISKKVVNGVNSFLSFFTQYRPDGPSPLASVPEYPENIPTVFITSMIDKEVPHENTERIAHALANKGKNDVYLLRLQRSSHPNYMFDDAQDRDDYETFIHAIYKKYNLQHDPELALKGEHLVAENCLFEAEKNNSALKV